MLLRAHACATRPSSQVPEVFSHFDYFSYQLALMDLSHFRQNALRNDMHAASVAQARAMPEVQARQQEV